MVVVGPVETARQQINDAKYKKAVNTLWLVEARARESLRDARAGVTRPLLDLQRNPPTDLTGLGDAV
jgi:hypothetical protein